MGMWVGRGRKARAAYGFDDIALVPGALTINPNEVDISWELAAITSRSAIIAAAMDGGVSLSRMRHEMDFAGWPAAVPLRGLFKDEMRGANAIVQDVMGWLATHTSRPFAVQSTRHRARFLAVLAPFRVKGPDRGHTAPGKISEAASSITVEGPGRGRVGR